MSIAVAGLALGLLISSPTSLPVVQAPASLSDAEADKKMDEVDALIAKAHALFEAGQFQDAVPVLEKALSVSETSLGEGPYTALVLVSLGFCYANVHEFDKAEAAYLRALAIYDSGWADGTSSHVMALGNLGTLYKLTGRSERAETYLVRAAEMAEIAFEAGDSQRVYYIELLADFYSEQGREADAAKTRARLKQD